MEVIMESNVSNFTNNVSQWVVSSNETTVGTDTSLKVMPDDLELTINVNEKTETLNTYKSKVMQKLFDKGILSHSDLQSNEIKDKLTLMIGEKKVNEEIFIEFRNNNGLSKSKLTIIYKNETTVVKEVVVKVLPINLDIKINVNEKTETLDTFKFKVIQRLFERGVLQSWDQPDEIKDKLTLMLIGKKVNEESFTALLDINDLFNNCTLNVIYKK
jgi:hypothetical protein